MYHSFDWKRCVQCINAVSKSGTIIDATQRVTMLFGQSTSQFNALQTEATSLRSQLYAELKSHVERAKLTQQQLQEAQRRESELKESVYNLCWFSCHSFD
jgi:hypothetical protein